MIYSGDTYTFSTLYQGKEDLTGVEGLCTFKRKVDDSENLVQVTGVVNVQEKTITFTLTSQQTESLRVDSVGDCGFSTVVYDTQLTFENGVVETTQKGKGRIYHDVTRA
tara:strand:- start:1098 stop:1424 length:327 start_codon:yes stop_codon:yes gene_type:complete